mgnify:FL=1
MTKNYTLALVFGANQHDADSFIDFLLDGALTPHWSAAPLAALEYTADDFSNRIKVRHNDVWEVGNSLNMDTWATDLGPFDIKTLDLLGATRSLNTLFVELAYYSQACQTSQSLLRDIEKMVELEPVGSETKYTQNAKIVMEKILHLKSWYDGIQARSDYLTRRAEALLQTVDTSRLRFTEDTVANSGPCRSIVSSRNVTAPSISRSPRGQPKSPNSQWTSLN